MECQSWLDQVCPRRTGSDTKKHKGIVFPVYLEGEGGFKCAGCKRNYVRVKGGTATEQLCETCVENKVAPKEIRMSSSRELNCDTPISFQSRDLFGKNFSHVRRDFIFGGEDWACASVKSTYDPLSGRESYACRKRGSIHIKLEKGGHFANSDSTSECAVICTGCAKRWLQIPGARSVGLN